MATKKPKIPPEESEQVEFKEFRGGISVKELAETICAFSNQLGGSIYLGVNDHAKVLGIQSNSKILDQIIDAARIHCLPPVSIKIRKLNFAKRTNVLKVEVEKSLHLHSTSAGKTYQRIGTQNKKIMGDDLLRLAESKTQVSYEEQNLDAGMEVIDPQALDEYFQARQKVSSYRKNISI